MLTPHDFPHQASHLVDAVRFLGAQGWCPATGGNFSTRVEEDLVLITQSGCDKRHLVEADLMLCRQDGQPLDSHQSPSAETALHIQIYQLDDSIQSVLHVHSVNNTLLSRHCSGSSLVVSGFEMQKSLSGIGSHDTALHISVFDNTQNIPELAKQVSQAWHSGHIKVPGLLVRGHGLYAWGDSIKTAQRHIEGFEFLFDCLWQERLLER